MCVTVVVEVSAKRKNHRPDRLADVNAAGVFAGLAAASRDHPYRIDISRTERWFIFGIIGQAWPQESTITIRVPMHEP